jgi:RNA-directed DNA polymerase
MKKDNNKSKTIVLTELQHKSIENISKSKLQAFQNKIYLKAKQNPKYKFYCLYDKVFRKDFILEAYNRVKANRGKWWVDWMEFSHLEGDDNAELKEKFLEQIHQELKQLKYTPSKLREVRIPKSKGKERILRIPTIKDRVVQMVIKLIIEPIFESTFKDCSYWYRPGKSAHDAVSKLRWELFKQMYKPEEKQNQIKSIDFSDCFNTIPQKDLILLITKRIIDRQLIKVIKEILETWVMKEWNKDNEKRWTPQWGVLSPLLSNIYLDKVDEYWETKEDKIKNKTIIRYADDIILLLDDKENKEYEKFIEYLEVDLKLIVNKEKSKTELLKDWIKYLGFELREKMSTNHKKYVATEPSRDAMKRIKSKIKLITDKKRNSRTKTKDVISNLNLTLKGWQQYYDNINMGKTRDNVNRYAKYKIAKLISNRNKKYGICWKLFKNGELYTDYKLYYLRSLNRILG